MRCGGYVSGVVEHLLRVYVHCSECMCTARPLPATYISKDFDYYFMKVAILRQNRIFQDENTLYLDSA